MIVLGLDGATFSLIEPWAESGRLPNFQRLLDESVHGDLESTVPEITVPAWPAFATGRDPTELDMYGFTHFNRDTLENDLSHDEFVPGKLWDVVDDQGGSSVVFNIPGSYPWQAIDGTIIAAAPEYKDEYAHPPERWDDLDDLVDGYKLRNDEPPGSRAYVDLSLELADKRFDAFEHFIAEDDPDLAVGLIRATDRVAHHYWGEQSVPPATTDNPVFEVYERVDERLGELLDAHEDEDLVVMSDHGFEKVRQQFAANVVLERAGLVSLTDSGDATKAALGSARDLASDVLGRAGLLTLARKVIPESALTDIPTGDSLGLDNALSTGRIDWSETRALADVGQKTTMVYALADDPDVVDRICDDAESALRDATEREGLDARFVRLDRGGPHTPDLCMVIETPEVHASSRFDADDVLFDVGTSGHAREGIFLARGPSFRDGSTEGATLTDVAPTVLHALGYRLPASMTGDVLDVFAEGSDPAECTPDRYDFIGADAVTEGGVTGDDEKEDEVKDRLRELGYLE
ncbi:Predicted phosphohydrolase or phosphomutase, AlkP superfamily [Natronoarchaeum philippinense]|uniref:Predicted phosphohydrolase or phosphomutase, AlkP superfamily n=1 Tax=Natronoarchaeum philippinense TaxID=558529 RepID=A0A285NB97_NATPI|nr:alkaline phosphatase family protein [Natronoarchaeum philippinense]SNZ06754.1 Predicted phosphohydrolase or phosphomutase, AlkP superfamily [Natronoarchaeum philippinense]